VLIAQRPVLSEEVVNESRSRFIIEPLEPGFGYALGNSLRRTLLSSIPGAAVTSIRVAGALHEFTTLEGVKEDLTDIVLNIKSGALDFLENYHNARKRDYDKRERDYLNLSFKSNVEHNFTDDCLTFLMSAMEVLYSMNYYNNSDCYRDYFDVAYYVDINIGKWDKPYLFLTK